MSTSIVLKTIGYYHRDKDMKATPNLYPKELNELKSYLENSKLQLPTDLQLTIEIPPAEKLELQMESLLDYIRQKGWPNGVKPDFVTNRNFLVSIASSNGIKLVYAYRTDGVIYLLKADKINEQRPHNYKYGFAFKYYATRESKNERIANDGVFRKAVFEASISIEGTSSYSVLYSGQIDAIDRDSQGRAQHYEIKSIHGSLENIGFWKNSCSLYWQSIFGMVQTLIIGSRSDKKPHIVTTDELSGQKYRWNEYPPFSIYKIEKLERSKIPEKMYKFAKSGKLNKWTVEEGKTTLRNFLKLVKDTATSDGDCFVFSRNDKYSEWIINRDEEAVAEFREVVLQNNPE